MREGRRGGRVHPPSRGLAAGREQQLLRPRRGWDRAEGLLRGEQLLRAGKQAPAINSAGPGPGKADECGLERPGRREQGPKPKAWGWEGASC